MTNSDKKYTVLIMSAPVGAGHKLAAIALDEVFKLEKNIEVINANVFSFFPKILGDMILGIYFKVLKYCPSVYEFAYKWGNKETSSFWLRSVVNNLIVMCGKRYLEKINPALVIATHATPAGVISSYKEKYKKDIILAAAITDFTIHKWWLCDGVDIYFTADELLNEKVTSKAQVIATGIPIRRAFSELDRETVRVKYDWKASETVCVIMGGGEGLMPMQELLTLLQGAQMSSLKIIAITGKNKSLEKQLNCIKNSRTEVYGFLENIPEIMVGADIVITKSGGLTASETLACGSEFIVYKPLPGQEVGNADFLQKNANVKVCATSEEVVSCTEKFSALTRNEKENIISEHKKAYGKPKAAIEIKNIVLKLLEK